MCSPGKYESIYSDASDKQIIKMRSVSEMIAATMR